MSTPHTLITELESALRNGTAERRAKTLRRVTDLFVFGSGHFSDDHVALFDNVFGHLIAKIDLSARAALAHRLAPVSNAPPAAIRALAFDDAIDVAGPVLAQSVRLDNATLIESASIKSQRHLLAIARRKALAEAVTDVLVERGDQEVTRCVAENEGAQFSDAGFGRLVERSEGDDELAQSVGLRLEIPRHHFIKLLTKASQVVRAKLQAAHPEIKGEIKSAVAEVATEIQVNAATASRDYLVARALVESLRSSGRLGIGDVEVFARAGKFEETTAALAAICNLPIDAIERAMVQDRAETIMIVAKAIGLSWSAMEAILALRAGPQGMSAPAMQQCQVGFAWLKRETSQRIVEFQRKATRPPAFRG